MKTLTFKTKSGRLTPYALRCGDIERKESNGLRLDLWQECPGNREIHVRAHDFNNGKRLFWETFETLTAARRFFDQKKREIFNKQPASSL